MQVNAVKLITQEREKQTLRAAAGSGVWVASKKTRPAQV